MENIAAYHLTGLAMGAAGGLLLLQLLVADVAGIRASHTPGTPVEPDHNIFLFRAARALANMNESMAIFILFTMVGILSGADSVWLGRFAALYVAMRTLYMLCYWLNIKLARSTCFLGALIALFGLGAVMTGGLLH